MSLQKFNGHMLAHDTTSETSCFPRQARSVELLCAWSQPGDWPDDIGHERGLVGVYKVERYQNYNIYDYYAITSDTRLRSGVLVAPIHRVHHTGEGTVLLPDAAFGLNLEYALPATQRASRLGAIILEPFDLATELKNHL